ncbi:hypothetical protein COT65_00205 [Candidatus Shapirobacteria bacterium CG09_land_8_20_14_0_10_47_13]|uniref:R3H domain-containing protein n=1 Tax=Candidatus Shapirobacteria bacterium CG09_land_8_20_14_0_10_47_13 TaxID=1974481 RepID=A0A2H0WQJ9_9BACT|nr:MAG: hypothetical protein COT65_00205 [Candidatus Shapirobacteria bacterium CG09_land_8_20_14_0_10_47_13]
MENLKLKTIEEITQDLLSRLGVEVKISVEESEGVFNVQLETKEPGILIGYHGETLAAIQLIVGMMVWRKSGAWTKILVNVGDYRERRQESLARMAVSVAQEAKLSGQPQTLPPMSAFDRRLIHLALAADPAVETLSEGEGKDRHVVVKTKQPSS